ncbi:14623_t:CDS:2 [Dentiscutata erythropus]|uniref:14623_t:CDS:1 n=1 Tax=Dentiscutata erythropus TaxID=1348616 RepID=A0A9N9A9R4_9GLOM|nr:14623_t:CDS:2 [Dentiscutata erythropus]
MKQDEISDEEKTLLGLNAKPNKSHTKEKQSKTVSANMEICYDKTVILTTDYGKKVQESNQIAEKFSQVVSRTESAQIKLRLN